MSLDYINLDRSFVPVKKGEEPRLEWTTEQGRRYGGWLDWQALLKHQRVVLLAEAGCGKTAEFRHQAQSLRHLGQAAFFARVEDLEDGIFNALDIGTDADFTAWKDGNGTGLFFLDSVDEARLSRIRFDKALRCLARDIGETALSRAHIFVSCRVSDWRGDEDRATFQEKLPLPDPPPAAPTPPPLRDWKATLLAPFDEGYQRPQRNSEKQDEATQKDPGLLVVQLAPLDIAQQRTFIQHYGIQNIDDFMDSLRRKQLEPLTERPRDLRFLVDYWNDYRTFASLSEMLEEAIKLRLCEINQDRRNQDTLSDEKARKGAERLAAGLVLGRCFTLRAPAQDDGHAPDINSIDAAALLPDWSSVELNNLLARGLFAPATYGRIRFHHRWAQEYLAACWLRRLLAIPGNRRAVRNMLFAKRYGVECSVPTLRPVAAWLALWDPDIRAELIRRAPLALIQHGDPTALPLNDRAELLRVAAGLHAEGRIADDGIDRSNLTLFADPALATVIHQIWATGPRRRFRFILLRLIREAAIRECVGIAREVALDTAADPHNRSVAIEAISACDDRQIIDEILPVLLANAVTLPAQVATTTAECFFPKYMSVEQLLQLIDNSTPSKGVSVNFDYILPDLFGACPNLETRLALAGGICQLCLAPPLVDPYHRVGKKHRKIAQRLTPIAKSLIVELTGEYHPALSAMMRVIQRCRQQDTHYETKPIVTIGAALSEYPALKQALFWEAAEEEARQAGPGNEPRAIFQFEQTLEPGQNDLEHFLQAVTSKPEEWQKCLALDVAVSILKSSGDLRRHAPRLLRIVADHPVLKAELIRHLSPRPRKGRSRQTAELIVRRDRDENRRKSRSYASWIKFRGELSTEPKTLCDPSELSGWGQSALRLWDLTRWLGYHTAEVTEVAVLEWPALIAAFGQPVADAYTKGMGILWRSNQPRRPGENGRDKITLMSYAAIGIEAKDNPDWARTLAEADAKRAAEHACLSEDGCPFWFDALLAAYPKAVGPVLAAEIEREMQSPAQFGKHFLSHYARAGQATALIVVSTVLTFLEKSEAASISAYDHALAIISDNVGALSQAKALYALTRARLDRCRDDERDLRHLALLFTLMPDSGVELMAQWIKGSGGSATERAAQLFSSLFDPHHRNVATLPLTDLSIPCLEALLSLVYSKIRPEADAVHEGVFSPDARDNAETARNNILKALLYRTGPDAHAALQRVGKKLPPNSQLRFTELAHEMAERDSNPRPWTLAEVIDFEERALLPIRNGEDLLANILGILEDIREDLITGDFSGRQSLRSCADEKAVQEWVANQLYLRSHNRFNVAREQVAGRGDKMDIVISRGPNISMVIEIKRYNQKGLKPLEAALMAQLPDGYLLVDQRRHGILLVTNHEAPAPDRQDTSGAFAELMNKLDNSAKQFSESDVKGRKLRAIGLDAAPADPGPASRLRPSRKP